MFIANVGYNTHSELIRELEELLCAGKGLSKIFMNS